MKKPSLQIAVHPLFWVFGIYFCFTKQLFIFILLTLSAIEHECAHAFAASKLGYSLNKIVLMPYGAVVKGDVGSISLKDEIFVAFAGPFISAVTALGFVALWWLFPETYAFTDTAAYACACLALVNLLPALPLDGGRITFCLLAHFFNRKRAWVVCRVLSFLFCLVLIIGFFYTLPAWNITLLFFALFLGVGCLQGDNYGYERIRFDIILDLKRGVEERRYAVTEDFPLRKIIPLLRRDKYLIIDVFSLQGERIATVGQESLCVWLETEDAYKELGKFIKNSKKTAISLEKEIEI